MKKLRDQSEGWWRTTRVASIVTAVGLPTWSLFYMSYRKVREMLGGDDLERLILWLSLFVIGYLVPIILAKTAFWVTTGFSRK